MNKKIYLTSPHMSEEGYEKKYIEEAFRTNWIAPLGLNVTCFEDDICSLIGTKAAVALNSGTSAIHMALKAAEVGEGDVVFCQSLTFSASANPIIYQKATPVFIDSDDKTWNMDPQLLEEAFKKYLLLGIKPKAVIIVHLYGIPAEIEELVNICRKYNTILIEDAAESLGSLYKGKYTGTFGDYGTYSFNGNKIITTSGGGMLVSNHKERIQKVRFWSTQSREPVPYYEHHELGYNYRMSNIIAGIGRGQLPVLAERIHQKKYIYNYYKESFKGINDIQMMPSNEESDQNCWLSCIKLRGLMTPTNIINALKADQIESRPIWKPMHLQPFFQKYDYIGNGISDDIYNKGLCLPSDTKMTDRDLERIVDIVIKAYS